MKLFVFILFPFLSFSQWEDADVILYPEVTAQYPDGTRAQYTYFWEHYFMSSKQAGRLFDGIYVEFVVERDGSLSNIEVLTPVKKRYHDRIIDVFEQMPTWIPAQHNGRVVRSKSAFSVILRR